MTTTAAATMKAIIRDTYGPPDELAVRQVTRPDVADDEVLVRVRGCSVNQVDWYEVTGTPWIARPMTGLRRPKSQRAGHDFAGTVEAVGNRVGDLRPGDDAFGMGLGAFAEYVSVRREAVGRKPGNLTFPDAAAVPLAGLTALQGLRDHGKVRPGQQVLVNGASGGVGTFALQIARALGAEVTAVCSTRNVEQARSLGAHRVIDYTNEDFTRGQKRYDVILDVSGSRAWSHYRRVMSPTARLVMVGSAKSNRLLGPLGHIARLQLATRVRGDKRAVFFVAKPAQADLETLRELVESAKVEPVVERRYELSEIGAALRHLGEGHARGKTVVTV
jgi:NADPH:quinone reductase-like Zn-dependent oxidoreductase